MNKDNMDDVVAAMEKLLEKMKEGPPKEDVDMELKKLKAEKEILESNLKVAREYINVLETLNASLKENKTKTTSSCECRLPTQPTTPFLSNVCPVTYSLSASAPLDYNDSDASAAAWESFWYYAILCFFFYVFLVCLCEPRSSTTSCSLMY